ncbi:MAG: hypothetical protein EAX90_03135 [Candidatus Heimdallarchaeota archaeon]|nr:hypothetical protein [Candidatus Heimdallarchaeota archaeon]
MWKPSPKVLDEPGIKYLELMGYRLIRSFLMMRIIFYFMGFSMVIASIVLLILDLEPEIDFVFYMIGGMGGLFLLAAILQSVFGVNKRFFNKIRDLRDSGSTRELKEYAYRGGMKSILAMYALVDLGEIDLAVMQGYGRIYYGQQSMYKE